ncbi:MAG: 4Fe-4S ferredoxin, partial [Methanobacteriota archaeon]
ARQTAELIHKGKFRTAFWLGSVLIGNLIPLVLALMGGSMLLSAAGALALIGIYITEHIWVRAPQMIPLS